MSGCISAGTDVGEEGAEGVITLKGQNSNYFGIVRESRPPHKGVAPPYTPLVVGTDIEEEGAEDAEVREDCYCKGVTTLLR